MKKLLFLAALLAAAVYSLWPAAPGNLLFFNGNILTLTNAPTAEAMWIRDGRIQAIGSEASVRAVADNARDFDLRGTTLLPGLIEPHTHPIASALLAQAVDISGFRLQNRAEIMAKLKEAVSRFSLQEWVIGFGWDPAIIEDLKAPTRAELDRISPERPLLILTQMMHDAYMNSAAIQAVGLDRHVPSFQGSHFEVDAQGRPTGVVVEVEAMKYVFSKLPPPPKGSQALLTNLFYGRYAAAGYTTVGTLGPVGRVDDPVELFEQLARDPSVPVRNVLYGLPDQLDALPPEKRRPGYGASAYDLRFVLRGVKFWLDGSPWVGGAAWEEPYPQTAFTRDVLHLEAGHRGTLFYTPGALGEQFARYHREGFQVAMHVQGERAAEQVIAAVAAAQAQYPRADARHRTEHNALVTPEQLRRLHQLGLTPSFFIGHIHYYGHRVPQLVGEERAARYMPVGSALGAGHRVSLHADNPATPVDALGVLRMAVERRARTGGAVIGPQERITVQQALAAMTIDAAWQLGLEKETGSLEVGKRADLTWLARNPLQVPPEEIPAIAVQGTWRDGRRVETGFWTAQNLRLAWQVLAGMVLPD